MDSFEIFLHCESWYQYNVRVTETKQRMLMYKAQPGVTWKMVKKKFPGFNYEQLDLFD